MRLCGACGQVTGLEDGDSPIIGVIKRVSDQTGVSVSLLLGQRREGKIMRARQVIYLLVYDQGKKSFPQIGRALGSRNHTTIMHGVKRAQQLYIENEEFRDLVEKCR